MNQTSTQMIASRIRGLAKELLLLAGKMDAETKRLADQMPEDPLGLFAAVADPEPEPAPSGEAPAVEAQEPDVKRTYRRVGVHMAESMVVELKGKVGKKEGLCIRNDIERALVRESGRTPEEVRKAVNEAADELRLTCFRSHGYRYYRIIDRKALKDLASQKLNLA